MINSIKEIIDDVLTRMEGIGIANTEEARNLVFETGMAESGYRHLKQIGGGPALSFWQIEDWVAQDIYDNFITYRKAYIELVYKLGLIESDIPFCIFSNIGLAAAFCRLHYRRKPGAIPGTMPGRAAYWKKHYNTPLGRGTPEHYLEANKQ